MPLPIVRTYISIFKTPKKNSLEFQYQHFAKNKASLTILQIGANDGLINDPLADLIFKFNVHAILIEPQPAVFHQFLQPLHQKNKNIQLINAAIALQNGTQALYTISFSNKRWATGLASFEKQSLEKSISSGYVERAAKKFNDPLPKDPTTWIKTIDIQTLNFKTLFNNYHLQHIDVFQIDVEGYDLEILKMFPFELIKPSLIGFETDHISADDLLNTRRKLEQLGYELEIFSRDALARLKE